MKNQKGFTLLEVSFTLACVVGLIGWVMNIVELINAPVVAQWGAMEVLRVVGIFVAPLGGVLGWF